ncbi:MAG: hypothetical protein QXP77_02885 [Candidatus Aenigmatarchaeota archaeon]
MASLTIFHTPSFFLYFGRIVALTLRADSFRIFVKRTKKFKIVEERVIESGGLYPHVFVLEKL